jgi:hypothetical protein
MPQPNPDPSRITAEHWRFILACRDLEPEDTGDLYPYADKPGYHNSRDELLRDGLRSDYSIRLAADKAGPGWATAAWDWISKSAQRGDRRIINRYGGRVRDAYNRRDARLKGWREVLTQVDAGRPEGFNFDFGGEGGGWYTRTPDDSHDWHHHLSKLRAYLADWPTYAGMLSIFAGEPLADWQAGRSRYLDGGNNMAEIDSRNANVYLWKITGMADSVPGLTDGAGQPFTQPNELARAIRQIQGDVAGIRARPPATVALTAEDRAEIIAGLAMSLGSIAQQAAEAAVRSVLGGLDGVTPPAG